MSVNVSGHDLALAGFPAMVADMLAATGMAPESLKLEITESILMRDPERASDSPRPGAATAAWASPSTISGPAIRA